jgi:very-short-patch-repair endonuclease
MSANSAPARLAGLSRVHSGGVFKRARQRGESRPTALSTGVDGDMRRQRRSAAVVAAPAGVDRRIALLATHQDGIVERRQLIAIGLSAAAIDHRVRSGRLIVLYRGVYAVGHAAQSERGTLRAALMAAGPTAAHSHLTAAARWKLIPSMPQFVEVTVTRKGPRSRRGLRIHETQRPPEIRILDSLPLTAPLRTLTDLARTQSRKQLERMCAEALVMKLVTQDKLDAAGILDPYLAAPTRSEFERRFYAQLRNARLPRPIAGYPIPPYTADFAWPKERVVVETDGWDFHGHRAAFEDDRERDAHLAANGWVVVRVTWRQLCDTPMLVMVRLAQTLVHRTATREAGANRPGFRR